VQERPLTAYIWRMCGRFTRNYTWQQIQALYRLTVPAAIPNFQPRYNVCPTDPADVVVPNEGAREYFAASLPAGTAPAGGVPGEENLDVVESLRKSKIKLILTRHGQAATFMAATHGWLTGLPGVCISTLGPVPPSFERAMR
jgi:putative SOS response-associated peptidase YedK